MAAKETTLNELGEMLTHVVEHMVTKDGVRAIVKEEIATLNVATKDDIAGIMAELADIKSRLKALEPVVENYAGYSKEIDHAFERIASIEKHLGITRKLAA